MSAREPDCARVEEQSAQGDIQAVLLTHGISDTSRAHWWLSRIIEATVECRISLDEEWLSPWREPLARALVDLTARLGNEVGSSDEIEFLELMSGYLIEFASYQYAIRDVLLSHPDSEPVLVPRIANIILVSNHVETVAFDAIVQSPTTATYERLKAIRTRINELADHPYAGLVGDREAFTMLNDAGLHVLPQVESAGQARTMIEATLSENEKLGPFAGNGNIIGDIVSSAYSAVGENSDHWRNAWLQWLDDVDQGIKQSLAGTSVDREPAQVALEYLGSLGFDTVRTAGSQGRSLRTLAFDAITGGANNTTFVSECLMLRLPDYGRLLWREARELHFAAHKQFEAGRLSDGGLVSLAYFRVLEVVYNQIANHLIALVPTSCEPEERYWKMLLRCDADGKRIEQDRLMVSELRDFYTQLGEKYRIFQDERRRGQLGNSTWIHVLARIEEIMTPCGMTALAPESTGNTLHPDKNEPSLHSNLWAEPLSLHWAARFRNPPAHTTFATFDIAEECLRHVTIALTNLYGRANEGGPIQGWVKLTP